MFNADCPFCGIARRQTYSSTENGIMWFKPLDPVTEGHMLFVPVQHFEHDDVAAAEWVGKAFEAAHNYIRKYWWDSPAFNLITSYGAASTQTVPHLHIHFVPRREGDGLQLPWGLPHE